MHRKLNYKLISRCLVIQLQLDEFKPLFQRICKNIRQLSHLLNRHVVWKWEIIEIVRGHYLLIGRKSNRLRLEDRVSRILIAVDDHQHHENVLFGHAANDIFQSLSIVRVDSCIGEQKANLQHGRIAATGGTA